MRHIYLSLLRYLTVLAAVIVASALPAFAQGQYAILTHDGTSQIFRGQDALIEANGNAEHGDMITLSPGTFRGTMIDKAITLRGAGMGLDGSPATVIKRNSDLDDGYLSFTCRVAIPNDAGKLVVEGIDATAENFLLDAGEEIDIVGSKIKILHNNHNHNRIKTLRFIHCVFDYLQTNTNYSNKPQLINSIVLSSKVAGYDCLNCVINGLLGDESTATNCVINGYSNSAWPVYSSIIVSNTYDKWHDNFVKDMDSKWPGNKILPKDTNVFKEGSATYELLEEYTTWLGNDGTQVGVHGGNIPFSATPSTPRISSLSVAGQTTPEGVLNFNISID